jgi:hypothetical protein
MAVVGRRWYHLDGDPKKEPVHTVPLMMWETPDEPVHKRFNWVLVEERCPPNQVMNDGECKPWLPLSTDPVCTGLDREGTAYDTPNSERYAKCLARAKTVCAEGGDSLYCACLQAKPLVPGVPPRCASDNACHVALPETTFLPDYRYMDPTRACDGVSTDGLDETKAELIAGHVKRQTTKAEQAGLIATYVILGLVVVIMVALTLWVVLREKSAG